MKFFKVFILLSALLAGMAVASCFAHGPRHYHHYHGRPSYYGHGLGYYQYPYGGYHGWGQPQVIIVQPQPHGYWVNPSPYGRPYYRF